MSNDLFQVTCDVCSDIAHQPYIECCECTVNLCTNCFASGKEKNNHKNNHKYAVRRNEFPLFDNCNWSAKEECKLLNALSSHGFGNWEEISKSVHTRSKLECQEHYKKYYIENVQYKELKLLPETEQSMFPKPLIPFLYSTDICTNPHRNNQGDQILAGYNAYRSDFEYSYDHNAENIFSIEDSYSDDDNEDDEDSECMDALKVSLLSALNSRLKERRRRYRIIQNHGLILLHKLKSWVQKYDMTLTRYRAERLLQFMQLMTGIQFDAFIESLHLEVEMSQRLSRLCDYRKYGVRTLYTAKLYKQLKRTNDEILKEQKKYTVVMTNKYECYSPVKRISSKFGGKRVKKPALPLDIVDLPGYTLLTESEKELCSNVRIVPESYLEIKTQLLSEHDKLGFLRLLEARKIAKIDVNKTRKLYDYLVAEGFINKPK